MHPHTQELLDHLDRQREVLQQTFAATPPALRQRKPAADRWSVTEILEHLAIVERRVATLLDDGLRGAEAQGPLPPDRDDRPILASIDVERVLDRERTVAAREPVQPTGKPTAEQSWQALAQSRQQLRDVLFAADGLDTRAIRAAHPVFGELDFRQWIAVSALHEARHAAQMRATVAMLQANAT